MPILLFRLNSVPADEAHEVRAILDSHHIDYYETDAGRWGISLAAIWLRDNDERLEEAQQLIEQYQQRRSQQARAAYAALTRSGRQETFLQRMLARPLQLLLYLVAILAILYLSLIPFLRFLH